MIDTLGRPLRNLRLSVTDRCNLRCEYCMPANEHVWLPGEDVLHLEAPSARVDVVLSVGRDVTPVNGGEPTARTPVAAPRHADLSVYASGPCGDDVGQDVPGATDGGGVMTDTPQLLLAHHLKALKLPTILREYDKLAQQCAAAFLADGVGADHVLLGARELFVQYEIVAQLTELGEKTRARDSLFLGRCRDVLHEYPGQPFLARRRLHSVGERLFVAQLVEEASAESAGDGGDKVRGTARFVVARRPRKSQGDRRLSLVA